MNNNKIVLVTGGTGGHIYPAISLAEELKTRVGQNNIAFIIDRRPLAKKLIKEKNYLFRSVNSEPFPRKEIWHICRFIRGTILGFTQSLFILCKNRPSILVSFGAYFSVPAVLAAYVLRIPVVIHEQNSFPGMANKFLSVFAKAVAVSFKESANYFPIEKTKLTGNPVRNEVLGADRDAALKYFNIKEGCVSILVFGGSLASESINSCIIGMLPYLEGYNDIIHFIHAAGAKYSSKARTEYAERGFSAIVFEYLDRMDMAYAASDIVIARAGATTVSELSALKKPSILIPFPGATSGHQALNARPLELIGGSITIIEEELSGESLLLKLVPLIKNPELREHMSGTLEPLRETFSGASVKLADYVMEQINVRKNK